MDLRSTEPGAGSGPWVNVAAGEMGVNLSNLGVMWIYASHRMYNSLAWENKFPGSGEEFIP